MHFDVITEARGPLCIQIYRGISRDKRLETATAGNRCATTTRPRSRVPNQSRPKDIVDAAPCASFASLLQFCVSISFFFFFSPLAAVTQSAVQHGVAGVYMNAEATFGWPRDVES